LAAQPYGSITERNVGAGFNLFELAEDEDAALRDDWADDDGRVRIQRGRVGIVSAARIHYPEIQVSAYNSEPPPAPSLRRVPMETLGTWTVKFKSRAVEVWSSDSYVGDELPLELPKSKGGRYNLRVAVGYRDTGGVPLEDYVDTYNEEHDEAPRGLERFVIDFWPAEPR